MFTPLSKHPQLHSQSKLIRPSRALLGSLLMLFSVACDRDRGDAQESTDDEEQSNTPAPSKKEETPKKTKKNEKKKRALYQPCDKDRDCESDICRRANAPIDTGKKNSTTSSAASAIAISTVPETANLANVFGAWKNQTPPTRASRMTVKSHPKKPISPTSARPVAPTRIAGITNAPN